MAEVWFFEKPGCINNSKQKQLLKQSGHKLIIHNLLEYDWDVVSLRLFFADLPVAHWFNSSAPAIKGGWIDPENLDEAQAMSLMMKEPILIRRPLMRVGKEHMVGFDIDVINKWIGLAQINNGSETNDDLESCPQQR